MQLSALTAEFNKLGINVYTITYDSHADALKFYQKNNINYPILRDVDATYVKAFDILNEAYEPGHRAYGIPHPGMFLVDTTGTVKAKFAEEGYKNRPPWDKILAVAKAMAHD